jgi:ribosomal protein S18 acetylase RimI-like enzyme
MISSALSGPINDLDGVRLVPLEDTAIIPLAEAIVAIPPWSMMNYSAGALAKFLASAEGGVSRYLVQVGSEPAGAVSVRHPWLKGPYLELLALLPSFQGRGIGSEIIGWFEEEGLRLGARNLWVCASSFNTRAVRFYRRHGFREAATFGGLVADGYDEILLRKFPLQPRR